VLFVLIRRALVYYDVNTYSYDNNTSFGLRKIFNIFKFHKTGLLFLQKGFNNDSLLPYAPIFFSALP